MLRNKRVFITGASSGLGEQLALICAQKGAHVSLCARRTEKLEQVQEKIKAQDSQIPVLINTLDITHKDSVKQAISQTVEKFGGLDIIIANAGKSMWTRFLDLQDPDELENLIKLNYMGVVYSAFFGLPHIKKNHGNFVVISSLQGVIPVAYHSGYVASKYAVNGFIDTLRLEEPQINFLLAMPSWIAGTELRERALVSKDPKSISVKKKHKSNIINSHDCAELIIQAIEKNKQELFIPDKYKFIPKIRNIFKNTIDKIVMKKVQGQLDLKNKT